MKVCKKDCWLTAFHTCYGHYKYQVMPFGLANTPAMFQVYINDTLCDLLDICCVVYLDDILIYSRNEREHKKHVTMVMECLWKAHLFIKQSKCEFSVSEVAFLGYIIGTHGISMEPD